MLDYKFKTVEFIALWHEYRKNQDSLVLARNTGDAEMVTRHLTRINELRDDIELQSVQVLNAIAAEDAGVAELKPITLKMMKGGGRVE